MGLFDTVLFDTVLVANRGEIAVRIIRTLHALGIRAAAVYSDADVDARHVRAADVAFRLGPAAPAESYLDVDRVIDAARRAGADALHPGYGFLSENAELAAACEANGIVFVGPPVAAIAAMGDKIRAKATVAANGVRVVPGAGAPGQSDGDLIVAARDIGVPLLIKPSAGGGGKGMRLVTHLDALAGELAAARREARNAFGDDTLLIERFIGQPRHIEVQIIADTHGNVIDLGERECSLQRRHQKIIEEAPSPYLDDTHRRVLADQAIAAARAVGYVNAGTVEFIVSGTNPDDAYFMEMNTRLQVEHPVTEMVWGIDLVEWQLRIAAGQALPFAPGELRADGHAIEARIYAEDPAHGFLPTGGRVLVLEEPSGDGVRVDSGLVEGGEVGTTYDPMLAKVVGHGTDRTAALAKLDAALAATTLLGVTTNIAFLRALLADPDVRRGHLDTGLVERVAPHLTGPALADQHDEALLAAALARHAPRTLPPDPWSRCDGWRVGQPAMSVWNAERDGHRVDIAWRVDGGDCYWRVDGEIDCARWRWVDATTLEVNGSSHHPRSWRVGVDGRAVWVGRGGYAWAFVEPDARRPSGIERPDAGTGAIASPMPGVVVAIHSKVGDSVREGDAVVSVEAMKMEHAVPAPFDGTVSDVLVAVGQRVALHETLALVARAGDRAHQ